MKKSMLCAGLLTILGASDYVNAADPATVTTTPPPVQGSNTPTEGTTQPNTNITQPTSSGVPQPTTPGATQPTTSGTQQPLPTQATQPTTSGTPQPTTPGATQPTTSGYPQSTTQPAVQPENQNTTTQPVTVTQPSAAVAPTNLDCNYKIPATTTTIEEALVSKWAENAAEQAFDFDFNTIDTQLSALKNCFTDQGWQSFNDALQKSGNLNAIRTEKLTVSSMVDGTPTVTAIKDNQWKVTLPLQVVYQNEKEKLNQPLTLSLIVGRKITGDLGIMQMIAMPRQPMTNAPTDTTATDAATPAPQPAQTTTNPSPNQ